MSEGVFQITLRDAVVKNDIILKDIRGRLAKQQHGFVMTREDLVDIEIQLATMAFIAARAQRDTEEFLENMRNRILYGTE